MHSRNCTAIEGADACPTQSGTSRGYRVEARLNYHTPKAFGDLILDNRWRGIGWRETKHGIPRNAFRRYELDAAGLLERNEAEALRWWMICFAGASDAVGGGLCLETRIVEYSVKYEFAATPVAYVDAMDMRGDLPDDMAEEKPPEETDD